MYVGSTDARGLHHLVYEVVDNSIDEALAGHCDEIAVRLDEDGSVTVTDDGRGIPVDTHEEYDRPAVEVIMTVLHAGGKFDKQSYQVSGGLHGVGVSVVNALSKWLEVEVRRDGAVWRHRFDHGEPEEGAFERVRDIRPDEETGTTITFWPDDEIFEDVTFTTDTLDSRLRELAFLNPGVEITLVDARGEEVDERVHKYDGGIREFVEFLNETKTPLHDDVVYFDTEDRGVSVEVALQATDELQGSLHAFANNINTREGGTHLTGFKTALTRVVNDYAASNGLLTDLDGTLRGEDVREGLTAVVSVKHPDPQFEGQTKTKLGNSEVRGIVESAVHQHLGTHFEEHPNTAQTIISKAVEAAKARKAAKKAEELTRRKSALESTALPGKLADCQTRDPEESELFVVEGDSAGGCFTGDTEIALASGRSITFEELVEEHRGGETHYCYTVGDDGRVGIEQIENPRVTRRDASLVEVTLDDGETITCTPDHEFMLRDGSYCEAQNLDEGQSLMPLYRKFSDTSEENISIDGYESHRKDVAETLHTDGGAVKSHTHTVESVETLDETADVYDIEVPETHNFALEAGVFVHNSAKQGRDREFQAILPLRGKILNVERHRLDRILENEEIRSLVTAVGAGIGEEFDVEEARYQRIILMSVDGREHAFVRDSDGRVRFVRIGEFVDAAVEADGDGYEGYEVLCFGRDDHATKFRPIDQMIRHEIDEPLYEIETAYGRSLRVTASHSVFVERDGEVELARGDEVQPGDEVVAPRSVPLEAADGSPERIDLLAELVDRVDEFEGTVYARGEGIETMFEQKVYADHEDTELGAPRVEIPQQTRAALRERREEQELTQADVCETVGVAEPITVSQWERGETRPSRSNFQAYCRAVGAGDLASAATVTDSLLDERWAAVDDPAPANRVRDYVRVSELDADDLDLIPDDEPVELTPEHYADHGIDRHVDVDETLLDLLGFYAADGSCSLRNGVRLAMGPNNEPLVEKYRDAFEHVFGIRGKHAEYDGRIDEVKLVNRAAAVVWQTVFGFDGSNAAEKTVPDLVFNVDADRQRAFLRGLLLGDGTVSENRIAWSTVSRDLASGLMYLLSAQGVVPSRSETSADAIPDGEVADRAISTVSDWQTVSVSAREDLERLRSVWEPHPDAADLDERVRNGGENPAARRFREISGDLVALEVRSVEPVPASSEYVYDFSVEGDENFVAGTGGLCAHNTDADVDGAHIRTLLLTLLYRHMRPLIERGYVYAAKPPLYRIRKGGETYDAMTEAEREQLVEEKCNGNPDQVQRFKGLGEMNPDQLWETTMNPENRVLKQITLEDAAAADKMFSVLMGDAVEPRKQFIKEHATDAEWVDI
jgi:DNA gyrase subunit B